MAKKIKGKGVISGIAIGNILLAGQNLDSFLVGDLQFLFKTRAQVRSGRIFAAPLRHPRAFCQHSLALNLTVL